MVKKFEEITASAYIPDQIYGYVQAVSGMKPDLCADCFFYRLDSYGVLVAWREGKPLEAKELNDVVEKALTDKGLRHFTVLSSSIPEQAPKEANIQKDYWWQLNLPHAKLQSKQETLLRRAKRDLHVEISAGSDSWQEEHARVVENFCALKASSIDDSSRYIFTNLKNYLASCENARLFSVKNPSGELEAFAIGDFSPFSTAMYMFAMRKDKAVPGASDLALNALIEEAEKRGYTNINLGLGINSGVEFFKKKWGASKAFPHLECSWEIRPKGFFARLFSNIS